MLPCTAAAAWAQTALRTASQQHTFNVSRKLRAPASWARLRPIRYCHHLCKGVCHCQHVGCWGPRGQVRSGCRCRGGCCFCWQCKLCTLLMAQPVTCDCILEAI